MIFLTNNCRVKLRLNAASVELKNQKPQYQSFWWKIRYRWVAGVPCLLEPKSSLPCDHVMYRQSSLPCLHKTPSFHHAKFRVSLYGNYSFYLRKTGHSSHGSTSVSPMSPPLQLLTEQVRVLWRNPPQVPEHEPYDDQGFQLPAVMGDKKNPSCRVKLLGQDTFLCAFCWAQKQAIGNRYLKQRCSC